MTENQIIKALKENERGYEFLPEEVQDWVKRHRKDMQSLNCRGRWCRTCDCVKNACYRLRPDYQAEPERIEIEIVISDSGMFYILKDHGYQYDSAPAFIPQKGYQFIGFRSKDEDVLRKDVVLYYDDDGVRYSGYGEGNGCKAVCPLAAVYERTVK